jgi:uncharacterized protein YyaL (SSP411 family)
MKNNKHHNKLKLEKSPYLLQHGPSLVQLTATKEAAKNVTDSRHKKGLR